MLNRALGSGNSSGNGTKWYEQDEIVDCKEQWQKDLAKTFIDAGLAMELKVTAPKETKAEAKPKTKVKRKKVIKK